MNFILDPAFQSFLAAFQWEHVIWLLVGLGVLVGIFFLVQYIRLSETSIQQMVHTLEQGGWVRRVKTIILLSAIAFVTYLWFFKEGNGFKGLPNEKAIEQAQIAREIARGHGFTTKVIRPAALWQFERDMGVFPLERTPDTYHAPLAPYIYAVVFKVMDWANAHMKQLANSAEYFDRYTYEEVMTTKQIVYAYDRMIAFTQTLFFFLAVLVNYFTAKRLFDDRLAVFSVGLMLLCERFWDFAMSGLPQMLMLFLFSGAAYAMVRAIEARVAGGKPLPWLIGVAALFGLLALAHALTIWLFVGALFFSVFYFRPRGRDAAIMVGVFLLFYGPWMIRNQRVCGNPMGLGWYSGLYQIRGSETQIMRSLEVSLSGVSPTVFRNKVQGQVLVQMSFIFEFLGRSLLAPVFFVALLHLFKRPETSVFRWYVLSMWVCGVFGMAAFGMSDSGATKANDLHILFVPLMVCYGLALVLVMWTRLDVTVRLLRLGFIWLLFIVSALPFINQFLVLFGSPTPPPVAWPPYVPPYIAILAKWTREDEIITSDMPWAVAWYADRKSLWLPMTVRDWLDLNDYNQLKGHIVGLHLTPITGNQPFISDIMKGEYKEWAPFIMRNVNTKEFPLKANTPLPIDGECIYYSDRKRWENNEE
ncbi:MAG: glycosyltransferase family 39 protein [Chthoniobacter sp.]|uniref:glycosyltransferase family 39 protein n=1 Tax=Chthoniobacter sp. TaxID=2510640 RepID=UPI0032A85DF3